MVLSRQALVGKIVSKDCKETWLTLSLLEFPEQEESEKETNIDPLFQTGEAAVRIVTDPKGQSEIMGTIVNVEYIENGTLYANVIIPTLYSTPPDLLNDYSVTSVELNLINKTAKSLGFDNAATNNTIATYDDIVLFGLNTANGSGLFTYDPSTDTANKEVLIELDGISYGAHQFK